LFRTFQVLHGFIRDCSRPDSSIKLDHSEPLYIIELGAGSGKFSYFMLKALEEMCAVCDFPFEKIVYVMTDFTEKNFTFWMNHQSLKRYFDAGRLDAGIFDAVNDTEIKLSRAGITLGPGSCKNPICIVANYLFDTLYHDIFQVNFGGPPGVCVPPHPPVADCFATWDPPFPPDGSGGRRRAEGGVDLRGQQASRGA
jgi:hypothetical protein